jgi:hypothetical protein
VQADQGQKRLISMIDPFSRDTVPEIAIVGEFRGSLSGPGSFAENPLFVRFLHRCIELFGPESPGLRVEASRQKNGIITVIDQRIGNIFGKVHPADIIGAFEVRGSQVHPETYRANPNYRLFTDAGFFQLDHYINEKILEEIRKAA